jgi:ribosomal protein S18 acetylase RimI-like enzyme
MNTSVEVIEVANDAVASFLGRAFSALRAHRGGSALEIDAFRAVGAASGEEFADLLARQNGLVGAYADGNLVAVALVHRDSGTLMGIFVDPDFRRQGVGRRLLTHLLESEQAPYDAWTLPGDRSSKSLFESAGWKARRLTMRAE